MEDFKRAVAKDVESRVWKAAAKFNDGKGLEEGGDLTVHARLRERFFERGQALQASLVLSTASGSCWTQARRFEAGLTDSPTCPRCGKEPETLEHRYWGCECNKALAASDVQRTQQLCERARRDCGRFPCLWLRGIAPASWTHPLELAGEPAMVCWTLGQPRDGADEQMHFYLD
eukprot:8140562-Alexandrium_andersonii.AAC.1